MMITENTCTIVCIDLDLNASVNTCKKYFKTVINVLFSKFSLFRSQYQLLVNKHTTLSELYRPVHIYNMRNYKYYT